MRFIQTTHSTPEKNAPARSESKPAHLNDLSSTHTRRRANSPLQLERCSGVCARALIRDCDKTGAVQRRASLQPAAQLRAELTSARTTTTTTCDYLVRYSDLFSCVCLFRVGETRSRSERLAPGSSVISHRFRLDRLRPLASRAHWRSTQWPTTSTFSTIVSGRISFPESGSDCTQVDRFIGEVPSVG